MQLARSEAGRQVWFALLRTTDWGSQGTSGPCCCSQVWWGAVPRQDLGAGSWELLSSLCLSPPASAQGCMFAGPEHVLLAMMSISTSTGAQHQQGGCAQGWATHAPPWHRYH